MQTDNTLITNEYTNAEETILSDDNAATEVVGSKYDLSLGAVMWESYFILSKASIGQIVKTFNMIQDRERARGNTELPDIICANIVNPFLELLTKGNNIAANNVRCHNMLYNLPTGVSINDKYHGKIRLSNAKIGLLIKCARGRVQFIVDRDIPIPKNLSSDINIEDYINEFNELKKDMIIFLKNIDEFEKEFVKYSRSRKTQTIHASVDN